MAGGVPVAVVRHNRIRPLGTLAAYVVVLVDDGNAPRFGQSGHAVECEVAPGAHGVRGQDDQCGAVAVRAFPELVQREGREVQCVLVDRRQILCVQERTIYAFRRRWLPPVEQRGVAGGAPAQQRHPGDQFGIRVVRERSAHLGVQPVRKERHAGQAVRGVRMPGWDGQSGLLGIGIGRSQRDDPVRASCRGNSGESVRVQSLAQPLQNWRIVHEVVVHEHEDQQRGAQIPREFVVVRQLVDLAGAGDPERRGRDVQMA